MSTLAFALALVLVAPGEQAADERADKDLKKLAGRWQWTPADGENGRAFVWHVAGPRWTIVFSEKEKLPGSLKLHPGTTPLCIDLTLDNKTVFEAICKIEGDTLTIRLGEPNARDRPTEFIPEGVEMKRQFILKRLRP